MSHCFSKDEVIKSLIMQVEYKNTFKKIVNPVNIFREVTVDKRGKNTKVLLFWSITKTKPVQGESRRNFSTCLYPLSSGRGVILPRVLKIIFIRRSVTWV